MDEYEDDNFSNCFEDFNTDEIQFPRQTSQSMLLIIFDQAENYYGAFRNEMIIRVPIFRAYGHGVFHGISKNVKCLGGSFPINSGVAVISFDSKEAALNCLESKNPMRETAWMGDPDMHIIPLCNSIRNMNDWNVLQIDFYDIKNRENFLKYLYDVEIMVHNHGGLVVAGTTNVMLFRGVSRSDYVIIYQWNCIDQAKNFNKEVENIIFNSGSVCKTRAIVEMDAYNNPHC